MSKHSFEQLNLKEDILHITKKLYLKEPTDIQSKVIPLILEGKSIMGQSNTGSGKTYAYLFPLLNEIEQVTSNVQVVITVPTRELAIQLEEEIKTLRNLVNKQEIWTTRLLIGGMERTKMIRQLKNNTPSVVIGTPGRILDMIDEGALSIYNIRTFVIDEADLMLNMKFIEVVDQLLIRVHKNVQILVFSATFPESLRHFIKKFLKQPVHIHAKKTATPDTLTHYLIEHKRGMDLTSAIVDLTYMIQPFVAILFTNGKEMTEKVGNILRQEGINVAVLHGNLSSRERRRIIRNIQNHEYEYIVATDLVSRGIHIEGVSHVINVELPREKEFYIHRVGRTARAGTPGVAISFFTDQDRPLISKLEKEQLFFQYVDIVNRKLVTTKRFNGRRKARNQNKIKRTSRRTKR